MIEYLSKGSAILEQFIKFIINESFEEKTIKTFLESFHLSKSNIYKLERDKKVLVNEAFYFFNHRLKTGDEIKVEFEKNNETYSKSNDSLIEVIHEDEDLLIVNKKTRLLVYSDGFQEDNLTDQINRYYQINNYLYKILPVHRIDYETSGMVIFAKHLLSLSYMSYLFENHQIQKKYICLCEGLFTEKRGVIDKKIGSDRHQNKQIISKAGKEAQSIFQVIKEENGISRVLVEILGGRKHQIRVHLSSVGHPILGDQLYGGRKESRLMLHFKEVSFVHPRFQKEIKVICPEPF